MKLIKFTLNISFIIVLWGSLNYAQEFHPYHSSRLIEKPVIFEEGVLSTDMIDYSATFTPDGKTIYFVRRKGAWGTQTKENLTIFESRFEKDKWITPQIAFFSGTYSDTHPFVSKDGNKIFFSSNRPVNRNTDKADKDIWMISKTNDKWNDPVNLAVINSNKNDVSPSVSENGNLYFVSVREGGYGLGDIYVSKFIDNNYTRPINVSEVINGKSGEWNLCIAPDESYMIFESSGRSEGLSPYGDLYISYYYNENWTVPQNLYLINTTGSNLTPSISPDGNYLFYASSETLQSQDVNIFQIDLKTLLENYPLKKE